MTCRTVVNHHMDDHSRKSHIPSHSSPSHTPPSHIPKPDITPSSGTTSTPPRREAIYLCDPWGESYGFEALQRGLPTHWPTDRPMILYRNRFLEEHTMGPEKGSGTKIPPGVESCSAFATLPYSVSMLSHAASGRR